MKSEPNAAIAGLRIMPFYRPRASKTPDPSYLATAGGASVDQPFRFTMWSIQIGAKGDVQPFETGKSR